MILRHASHTRKAVPSAPFFYNFMVKIHKHYLLFFIIVVLCSNQSTQSNNITTFVGSGEPQNKIEAFFVYIYLHKYFFFHPAEVILLPQI